MKNIVSTDKSVKKKMTDSISENSYDSDLESADPLDPFFHPQVKKNYFTRSIKFHTRKINFVPPSFII